MFGGEVEDKGEGFAGVGEGVAGVFHAGAGFVELDGEAGVAGGGGFLAFALNDFRLIDESGLGGEEAGTGGLEVDEGAVEVADLTADDVLILGLEDAFGGVGDLDAGLAFLGEVEGDGEVGVVLGGAAGPDACEGAVGDELAVDVENGVGAKAGGEDIGVGLGDFEFEGLEVEVVVEHVLDGGVEGDPGGGALVVDDRGEGERRRIGGGVNALGFWRKGREVEGGGGLESGVGFGGLAHFACGAGDATAAASATADDAGVECGEWAWGERARGGGEVGLEGPRDRSEVGEFKEGAGGAGLGEGAGGGERGCENVEGANFE